MVIPGGETAGEGMGTPIFGSVDEAAHAATLPTRSEDLHRSERVMILLRWAATPWMFVQVLTYRTAPYPPGVRSTALVFATLLPAANIALWTSLRLARTQREETAVAIAGLAVDTAVAMGFVWLFAFDQMSALWAIVFILPIEGAILFQLFGAMTVWGTSTILYTAREIWGSNRFAYKLQWESVSFRMGIGFLISLAVGLMAQALIRQREELAIALRDLRRVDRLRAGLIATLAHDVRTPLTAIRASVQTLIAHPERAESTPQLLSVADRQARRLERLAHQLLDLTRLEQGQLELDIRDLKLLPVLRRALTYADGTARIDVTVGGELSVRADPDRLEQIVVNLATNQVRYGEPPFVIEAHRRNGEVALAFRDHGRGIPPDKRAALFEPFGARSDAGSVGLGLAIVRALVDAHGGRVSYREDDGGGACFEVVLPAGAKEAGAGRAP